MKTKLIITLGTIAIGTLLTACGGGSSSSPATNNQNTGSGASGATNQTRFAPMTMMDQNIMRDANTNLEWVNGNAVANVPSGCLPMPSGKDAADVLNTATNHCDALSFASHEDWRVPTITEIQEFTVAMKDAGLTPFYANPACPRLVGLDTNGTIQTINTHNTDPIGKINDWIKLNAGVRCVRAVEATMMTTP